MDITKYDDVYVLDCGQNHATYSHNGKPTVKIKTSQIIQLVQDMPRNSCLISEYAHLGYARKELSLSQPLDAGQLISLYAKCKSRNIDLKLFPQKSMPRACEYAFIKNLFPGIKREKIKDDTRDPISIYHLLLDFPEISLANPPNAENLKRINPKIQEAWDFKDYTNVIANYARKFSSETQEEHESGYVLPMDQYRIPNDGVLNFFLNNADYIYDQLDDYQRDIFGLQLDTRKNAVGKLYLTSIGNQGESKGKHTSWKPSIAQIYSVIVTLMDHEGNYRYRPSTLDFAGWAWVKRFIFCMTPFHFRGGVIRSNTYYHGMRSWVAKMAEEENNVFLKNGRTYFHRGTFTPEQDAAFRHWRIIYVNAIRKLFQICKSLMIAERDANLEKHQKALSLIPKDRTEKQLELMLY